MRENFSENSRPSPADEQRGRFRRFIKAVLGFENRFFAQEPSLRHFTRGTLPFKNACETFVYYETFSFYLLTSCASHAIINS
jgi:hypothetical protein